MKHFTFDNHWDAIKGQLKQRYGQLTDDDLVFAEGKGEEILARLREKLGLSEGNLDALLSDLQNQAAGKFDHVRAKVGEFANEARAKAGEVAEDLKAKAAAVGEEARAQAAVAYDRARQRVGTMSDEGKQYVRQNPRESLVAALFAGFVVGLLLRR